MNISELKVCKSMHALWNALFPQNVSFCRGPIACRIFCTIRRVLVLMYQQNQHVKASKVQQTKRQAGCGSHSIDISNDDFKSFYFINSTKVTGCSWEIVSPRRGLTLTIPIHNGPYLILYRIGHDVNVPFAKSKTTRLHPWTDHLLYS